MKKTSGIMLCEAVWNNLPVIAKGAGMDFIIVDTEHGGFDYGDLSSLAMIARLAEIRLIIRLADHARRDILRFMDMGAAGLLLPMTETKEQIEQVVSHAKYRPEGQRGMSITRAHSMYSPGNLAEYQSAANARCEIYAQIETVGGLDNLDDILSVGGVNGVFLGPNDLAADLGCMGDPEPILGAIEKIADRALSCGKKSGIITSTDLLIRTAEKAGMELFCIGSEISIIKQGLEDIVNRGTTK